MYAVFMNKIKKYRLIARFVPGNYFLGGKQMAITTLIYNIDTTGITPSFEQSAGTQGDHRATGLMFVISDSLYEKLTNTLLNARLMYRFDIYDGEGGLWSSEAKELNDKNIGFELEERHTRYGGKITVYTVITALTDNGETETELYSVPVVLRLANKPDGVLKNGESYESMTSLSESAKISAELARLNADTAATKAADAGNSANASKISSDEAALCVDKAEQLVLEAENTVNKALEPINDEMTAMASAINSLESNLSSQYYNKSEVDEAVISCVPRKRLNAIGAPFDSVIAVNNSDYNQGDADGNGYGMPNDSSYKYIDIIGDELGKDIISQHYNAIVKRDSKGNLFTGTPIDDEDCVNKKYVDEKIAEIPSGGGGETWEVISDTTTEFNTPVSQIVINQDTNGNSFSLKKMRVFIDFTVSEAYTGIARGITAESNLMYIVSQSFSAGSVYGYFIDSEVLPMVNNRCQIISHFNENRMLENGNNFDFNYNIGSVDYGIRTEKVTVTTLGYNVSSISNLDFRLGSNGKINKARILIFGVRA